MLENANALKEQFLEKVNSAASSNELEQLRIEFLGKKGPITSLMSELRNIPNEQKKEAGQIINEVKQFIEKTLTEKNEEIKKAEEEALINSAEDYDVSFPLNEDKGSYHPITLVQREVEDIFIGMGYDIAEGPEVELDYYNFEALNIPKNHPARSEQDTFYINDSLVLRTQTSPVQIRVIPVSDKYLDYANKNDRTR